MDLLSQNSLSITVLIAVRNEAANISRCLKALGPAERIVVIDSQSCDSTTSLAEAAGVEVVQFNYSGSYPKKRQWALQNLTLTSDWILFLDADEIVPTELWTEIAHAIQKESNVNGYLIKKGFHFLGRKFTFGGFSHEAVLLLRRGKGRFEKLVDFPRDTLDMEVHERVIVEGEIGILRTPLIHEDFKGLEAYIDRHNRYSSWEAYLRHQLLLTGTYGAETVLPKFRGDKQQRRRWLKQIAVRVPFEPWLWFAYHYVFQLGFLEGRPGLIASQIRMQYISNVRAKMYELMGKRAEPMSEIR